MAVASYDKTSGTWDPAVDPVLWPMLCVHSQLIDSIPKDTVEDPNFEWETANTNSRQVTGVASGTTINGSGSATALALIAADGATISVGDVIRNVSAASPIGTYGVDELMEVTANTGTVLTLFRDAANQNSGTGYASYGTTDTYEVVYPAKLEGSSPGVNRYKDVSLVSAHTQIMDLFLTVTGTQMASKRLVVGDTLARQFDDRVVELTNFVESMFVYGAEQAQNSGNSAAGSATYPRRTKGFVQYVANSVAANWGVLDATTKDVTEYAINTIMQKMADGGQDMAAKFLIAGNNFNMRKIAAFGADKVRITQNESIWGRAIKALETDLGVDLTMNPCHNITKTDVLIVNTAKCKLVTFRAFESEEYGKGTSTPNGTDAWCKRYLGEVGVKVIDGAKAHGLLTQLPWS